MATYMIEHLKTNPGHKPGTIIKAGSTIAQAGLTGQVSANGHLLHICKAKESGKKINDFSRGGNSSYVNATIHDPQDLFDWLKQSIKSLVGTWSGTIGYLKSDGVAYPAPKQHLGGDCQYSDGNINIKLPYDIKVIECGSESSHSAFGNCMSFEVITTSQSQATKKEYFKVLEDKHKTHRYYSDHAQYKVQCNIETGVYCDPDLNKKHDTANFAPGQKTESNHHSHRMINGKSHNIHVLAQNQNGKKIYFALNREL